jgi:superfamily II DNA or RNA helicase
MTKPPTTNYPLEIKKSVDDIAVDYKSGFLKNYQYIVKEYLVQSDIRGLLLYHSPGTGKSITSAAISEYYRNHDPTRKIIVLLSKSLRANFENNIKKYIHMEGNKPGNITQIIENKYQFISLNASNMYTQLENVDKTAAELEYEKYLGDLNTRVNPRFLENSLLIVDEAHNLSNSIKNGSKNAVQFYDKLMKTRNIKIVFLTGTPIVSTPFELVPLFNMLKGPIHFEGGVKDVLFSEDLVDFNNFFIHHNTDGSMHIKNKDIFQNRIVGLVSYYGDYYFQKKKKEGFPVEYPLITERIPMSIPQFSKYQEYRYIEIKEASSMFGQPRSEGFVFKDKKTSSSYRIRSRQVSNFLIPSYAYDKLEKNIYKIEDSDLKDLGTYSPKFAKIIENLDKYTNQLNVVYSEFVNGEGINLFARVLEVKEGYTYWRDSPSNQNAEDYDFHIKAESDSALKGGAKSTKLAKSARTYAIISGNVPFSERDSIIKAFNADSNKSGEHISLLLISRSGAEGLNLKNVRSIHIMEPFWNYARIEQIIARGSRLNSHKSLPPSENNIQPYIYISIFPKSYKAIDKDELNTTDEELLETSLNRQTIRKEFELALVESSVDCSFNTDTLNVDGLKCHLCLPDGAVLYTNNLYYDIKSNKCQPLVEQHINVKKISLDGVDYYYTKDGMNIKIYEFNHSINGYIEMKKGDIYAELSKKILKF